MTRRQQLSRRAFKHDAPAFAAAFGTHVDDPVGVFDDAGVVLDHDHRVTSIHQAVHDRQQMIDVRHVQAGGGLVHDVDAAFFVQLTRQLNALTFATRKRAERLTQPQIIQTHVIHGLQP